mgnify:CR=1 FL=1
MENYKIIDEKGSFIIDRAMMKEGLEVDAGSKALEGYKAPYTASLIKALEEEDYKIFGQGMTSEFSLEEGLNGVVDALAEDRVSLGLGLDNGGNLLRAGGAAGIFTYLPSPGLVSSYGLIKTSRFTRLGLMGEYELVLDAMNIISGKDPMDPQTLDEKLDFSFKEIDLNNIRAMQAGDLDRDMVEVLGEPEYLEIEDKDKLALAYDVISSVDLGSSTAKFDGIRYGYRPDDYENLDEYYSNARGAFGEEVKKQILKGYIYSAKGYEREIYDGAMGFLAGLDQDLKNLFKETKIVLGPVDSLPYLAILTNRPVAALGKLAIMADYLDDVKLLNFVKTLEEAL